MSDKNPKRFSPATGLLLKALLIAACFTPSSARARDLWVEAQATMAGDGSPARPFQSIQQAARLAQPGDTVPKGSTDPAAVERILALWTARGAPGENPAAFPFGAPAKSPSGYRLSLEQWRAVTGFDRASRASRTECAFDTRRMTLTLTLPAAVSGWQTPREEAGLDADFFGKPFPDACMPGPFPELKPGKNTITLAQDRP